MYTANIAFEFRPIHFVSDQFRLWVCHTVCVHVRSVHACTYKLVWVLLGHSPKIIIGTWQTHLEPGFQDAICDHDNVSNIHDKSSPIDLNYQIKHCSLLTRINHGNTMDCTYNESFYNEIQEVIKISHLTSRCAVLLTKQQVLHNHWMACQVGNLVERFVVSVIHCIQAYI